MFRRSLLAAFALLFVSIAAAADTKTATVTTGKALSLEYVGREDGQDTWRGVVAETGALLEYDVYPHAAGTLYSLTVDMSRNDPTLRNVPSYTITIDGHACTFAEPQPNMAIADPVKREADRRNRQQRIMCRTRFTWGERPPRRPQSFYEFGTLPRQPEWKPADWSIELGGYGQCASVPTATASGNDRSCHHPNWYGSDEMLRAYADADGNYPVAVREPTAPFAPIARDGFQMGYNDFDFAAYAVEKNVGRKFQLPHATANSVLPWLLFGDLYYKRSLINAGNYAAMYNGGNWPGCASEYRGVFRGLNAMLVATAIDGNEWRKRKIVDTLSFFDERAAAPFGTLGVKGGVPFMITTKDGRTFINYWMANFAFYTIDLAGRLGYPQGQAYLKALMDFQEQLSPANVGVYSPYWLQLKDTSKPIEPSNLFATGESGAQSTNDREAELYVVGEIMRRHGRKPPRPLADLMHDAGNYSMRNFAAFFIADSTRPPKPKFVFDGTTFDTVDAARDAARAGIGRNLEGWDGSASFEATIKIDRK
jgi:hypothetical protein